MSLLSWLKSKTMRTTPKQLKIEVIKYSNDNQLDPRDKRIVDTYLEEKWTREKRLAEQGTVKEELVTQAERFQQSFHEFLEELRGYPVATYHQHVTTLGPLSYGDCIRRSVEELADELHQIEGLLSGASKEDEVDECNETTK